MEKGEENRQGRGKVDASLCLPCGVDKQGKSPAVATKVGKKSWLPKPNAATL
jgi:hypothetical protein